MHRNTILALAASGLVLASLADPAPARAAFQPFAIDPGRTAAPAVLDAQYYYHHPWRHRHWHHWHHHHHWRHWHRY